jgi:hypothetical protein
LQYVSPPSPSPSSSLLYLSNPQSLQFLLSHIAVCLSTLTFPFFIFIISLQS